MKSKFLIYFLLWATFTSKADYSPRSIYEMILGAEKIVYGEITEVDSLIYTLKIEGNLTGIEKSLEVLKFRDWPCASRWTEYQAGQKLFLFLKKYNGEPEKFRGLYYSMSAGNEGELPLLSNCVYINGRALNSPPPHWPDSINIAFSQKRGYVISLSHHIYGKDFYGHQTALDDFIATINTIRNCFNIKYDKYDRIDSVAIICSEEELENKSLTDPILSWAFKNLKNKTGR